MNQPQQNQPNQAQKSHRTCQQKINKTTAPNKQLRDNARKQPMRSKYNEDDEDEAILKEMQNMYQAPDKQKR